jgi:PTH1 family peptidyl-tRNA hydrolase
MNVIFGLGNPGTEYLTTRHNAGFLATDFLAREWSVGSLGVHKKTNTLLAKNTTTLIAQPQTFMNRSGEAVQATLRFFEQKPQKKVASESEAASLGWPRLAVIFDDLDIEFGNYKIQWAKGPKVHNGLSSVYQQLGTDQFWHVRIGVDNRQGQRSMPGERYVLQPFTSDELHSLSQLWPQLSRDLRATL